MEICDALLAHCPGEPISSGELPRSVEILVSLSSSAAKLFPGLIDLQIHYARALFLSGKPTSALQYILMKCLKQDGNSPAILLLQAEIQLAVKQYSEAQTNLETCVSYNFDIRNQPRYRYLKAKCDIHADKQEEALSVLNTLVTEYHPDKSEFPKQLLISICLDLVQLYMDMEKYSAGRDFVATIMKTFTSGSQTEMRFKLLLSEMEMKHSGKYEEAIQVYNSITIEKYGSESYSEARLKLAELLLNHKHDQQGYIQCHKDLVKRFPDNYRYGILLGDAFMNVQLIKDAIQVYQEVSASQPDQEAALSAKIGKAWLLSHNYKMVSPYRNLSL